MNHSHRITLLIACVCAVAQACNQEGGAAASSLAPEKSAALAPEPAPAAPPAAPAAAAGPKAELGKPAPDFTLTDTDGNLHVLSALKGKTVVLEWFNPDCPFVKFAHGEGELKTMAAKVMGESLVWLSINSGAPGKQGHGLERNRAARGEYAMQNPVLLDETGAVGRSYGAQKTPHLFVVGKDGTLLYRGAIDNAPIGKVDPERPRPSTSKEGALVNYVSTALDDLAAQRALRLPDTPAYGCSVKYQS